MREISIHARRFSGVVRVNYAYRAGRNSALQALIAAFLAPPVTCLKRPSGERARLDLRLLASRLSGGECNDATVHAAGHERKERDGVLFGCERSIVVEKNLVARLMPQQRSRLHAVSREGIHVTSE